ncbi:3-oxoacyl-ACP reductase [Geotalea uraniireducens]|uniref:3-oxoacyl-ACP reductase n=1 Tax=Geotalea uraniireducens TaxID=351604 RepID=A0ABM8ERH5_9BACT|nr:SDR family NAD(P)-dependent oxidoreductase [Geotalea uraniireducens]BDV44858.1 3-oxoacyl-ACP reductase [Geotalea uraniireducens]
MSDDLAGKIALVTGGSRGIGRAIALALAAAGAEVAVNYRSRDSEARETCEAIRQLGRQAVAIRADIARPAEVRQLPAQVRRELGPVAILVNNAGIATARTIETITEQEWDETLAVNLTSAFLVTQAALPDMRAAGWGRIISISSVAAQMGGVVGPHYAASKAGIIGLTHYYAAQLAGEGITANAIAPGPVATDMAAALPQLRPESLPVGRFGTAAEIAEVAVLLARNGYITGQTININGGRYLD